MWRPKEDNSWHVGLVQSFIPHDGNVAVLVDRILFAAGRILNPRLGDAMRHARRLMADDVARLIRSPCFQRQVERTRDVMRILEGMMTMELALSDGDADDEASAGSNTLIDDDYDESFPFEDFESQFGDVEEMLYEERFVGDEDGEDLDADL